MLFPEHERLIYRYSVGGKEHFADPLVLRRRLVQAGRGELDEVLEAAAETEAVAAASAGPPLAMLLPQDGQPPTAEHVARAAATARGLEEARREEAREKRAKIVFEAFKLTPLDEATGEGVTEYEALQTLWDFLEWLEKNASPAGSSPPPSPSAGGPPAGTSPTRGGSPSS
jgi:hypothetical protein